MEGREGGYIVIHRRIESSALWRAMTAEQRATFITILLLANWKADRAQFRHEWYEVRRGEFSHTLATIAKRAGTSVKVVRTTLALLMADDRAVGGNGPAIVERYPIPGTGPGTGPRLLTVVNYEKYQSPTDAAGTGLGTGEARVGHGSGTGRAQREEGEERKKVNKTPPSPSAAAEVVAHWRTVAWPKMSPVPCPEGKGDFGVVGRLLKTGVSPADVKLAMDRAAADEWWRDKLDLPTFCAKFPRFLPRNAPEAKGYSAVGGVGDFSRKEANEF